ncbi:hypothetical protein [Burkholderia sp. GbtcB21]|uniref:hypothetical protein n=1 Tax=Burkholderia sp. GbtcB21 TaxID=2824766 RepID=UPI001C3024D7|nr:hypothetical protein [Burkholderia sp. GbtcB21]
MLEGMRARYAAVSRVPDAGRSTREDHAAAQRPTTRERAIEEWRFMVSLRMDFIFCCREFTAIRAGESIARRAGGCRSDKTYLFFIDFRCSAIRPSD